MPVSLFGVYLFFSSRLSSINKFWLAAIRDFLYLSQQQTGPFLIAPATVQEKEGVDGNNDFLAADGVPTFAEYLEDYEEDDDDEIQYQIQAESIETTQSDNPYDQYASFIENINQFKLGLQIPTKSINLSPNRTSFIPLQLFSQSYFILSIIIIFVSLALVTGIRPYKRSNHAYTDAVKKEEKQTESSSFGNVEISLDDVYFDMISKSTSYFESDCSSTTQSSEISGNTEDKPATLLSPTHIVSPCFIDLSSPKRPESESLDSSPLNFSYLSDELDGTLNECNKDELGAFSLDTGDQLEVTATQGTSSVSLLVKRSKSGESEHSQHTKLDIKVVQRQNAQTDNIDPLKINEGAARPEGLSATSTRVISLVELLGVELSTRKLIASDNKLVEDVLSSVGTTGCYSIDSYEDELEPCLALNSAEPSCPAFGRHDSFFGEGLKLFESTSQQEKAEVIKEGDQPHHNAPAYVTDDPNAIESGGVMELVSNHTGSSESSTQVSSEEYANKSDNPHCSLDIESHLDSHHYETLLNSEIKEAEDSSERLSTNPNIPRKSSILRVVYNKEGSTLNEEVKTSKIPIISPQRSRSLRQIIKTSPVPKYIEKPVISEQILNSFFNSENNSDCESFLEEYFGADPDIIVNEVLLGSLTESDIDFTLNIFQGKEDSENWKERFDYLDIIIGHLRLHLPEDHYDFFQSKISERMEDILEMAGTTRSKLLPKVIIFIRDFVYYGQKVTDREFITLIHLLIPLTKSKQTLQHISKLAMKSLCLMIQSINIDSFLSSFDEIFAGILSSSKPVGGAKYTCLFMIKFYLLSNIKKLQPSELDGITSKIVALVPKLCMDRYPQTRSEVIELYLVCKRIGVSEELLLAYHTGLTSYLKKLLPLPSDESTVNKL